MRRWWPLAFAGLTLACAPSALTQVSVRVDGDDAVRAAATTLEVSTYDGELEHVETQSFPAAFPQELVAYQVHEDVFVMEIAALDASGGLVARRSLRVAFADEQVKLLDLTLEPRSTGCPAACAPDEECRASTCDPVPLLDAATLPDRPGLPAD